MRLSKRHVIRLVALLVAIDVIGLIVSLAIGLGSLFLVQREAQHPTATNASSIVSSIQAPLRVASVSFTAAQALALPWSPIASLVGKVTPLHFASQLTPALTLARDASTLGADTVDGAVPLLSAVTHKSASVSTTVRLFTSLQSGHASFTQANAEVRTVEDDLQHVRLNDLPLPRSVRSRVAPAEHFLPRVSEILTAIGAAPSLLGDRGPVTYLIVPENSWDLRATGGFIGTEATLTIDRGHLSLASMPSDVVDDGRLAYIPPPLPLIAYAHFSNWFYRDANWFPNFPTTASLLRYFYWLGQRHVTSTRYPVGVIAFDTSLLSPLLSVTGPVTVSVDGHAVTIDAAHGIHVLDHYINASGTVNKSVAGLAYSSVFRKLTSLHVSELAHAAAVFGTSAAQRHLLIWLQDTTIESIVTAHHWDGAIEQSPGDYFYVVDTNVHYNKINNFIKESTTYSTQVRSDRSLYSRLTLTYTNTATLATLPPPQNNTLYEDFVRIYVPLGSHLLHVTGLTEHWSTERDNNRTVFSGYFRVPSLTVRRLTFVYSVPANALLNSPMYTLHIQKQPGIVASVPLQVSVTPSRRSIHIGSGSQWQWRGKIQTDLQLETTLSGGNAMPKPLALDGAPTDARPGSKLDAWTTLPVGIPYPPLHR